MRKWKYCKDICNRIITPETSISGNEFHWMNMVLYPVYISDRIPCQFCWIFKLNYFSNFNFCFPAMVDKLHSIQLIKRQTSPKKYDQGKSYQEILH